MNLGQLFESFPLLTLIFPRHRWLNTVTRFASVIQTLVSDLKDQNALREDVKIAVIDDSVDAEEHYLYSRIATEGWPPDHCEDSGLFLSTFYTSSGGHGTKMARLITEVCPAVKLYVAKLEQKATKDGSGQFTAKSAAEVRYTTIKAPAEPNFSSIDDFT